MSSDQTADHTGGWEQSPSVAAAAVADVLTFQEREWDRGERPLVEDLLSAHPSFADNANAILELVCNEVVLREEHGERPTLAEYQERFPELAEPLRIQWEVDRALFSRRSGGAALGGTVAAGVRPPIGTVAQTPENRAQLDAEAPATTRRRSRVTGQMIGRYRIESVLGKGGMGVAYRAWDPDLKRLVAVKTLRVADADDSEIARFRTESEAIARVRHPNIVQVFDVGEEAGQPFFAMEFCSGGSLAGYLKAAPLGADEAAAVVEQIARGVDAAHRQNIVHRDLKPANVLLSHDPTAHTAPASTVAGGATAGSTATTATNRPAEPEQVIYKVTDFGLAKALDTDDGQTRTGEVMGTPCYMSPEQAFGRSKTVGVAADVYAIGAILYECLTGFPPFRGATTAETLEQVRHREPVAVRQLQPSVPVDLETIALKCLQKEPDKRYATAADVADDLRRYLERRPILARPFGPLYRAWRWCRRNPTVAFLLAAVFLSLTLGLTGTTIKWVQERAATKRAEKNLAESEESLHEAFRAVNESFVKLSEDRLLREPHMLDLRKELLTASQPYFESFVQKRRGDPKWKKELAHASTRLAILSMVLDPPAVSMAKLQRAVSEWEELLRENPDLAEAHIELAKVLVSLGYEQRKIGQWVQAEHSFAAAVEHLRAVPNREALGYEPISFEAMSLSYQASIVAVRGSADRATELHQNAIAIQQRAIQLYPGPRAQMDLGVLHFLRGQAFSQRGDPDASAVELALAEKQLRTVAGTRCPQQAIARRNLASTLSVIGLSLWHSRTTPDKQAIPAAAQKLAEAHELWEGICIQYPEVVDYQISLSEMRYQVAKLGMQTGQLEHSETVAQAALNVRAGVYSRDPNNPTFITDLADSYTQVREVAEKQLSKAANDDEANRLRTLVVDRESWELNFLVKHHNVGGVPTRLRGSIPNVSADRARLLTELGRYDEARIEWDRAIRFAPPELRDQFTKQRQSVPAVEKNP